MTLALVLVSCLLIHLREIWVIIFIIIIIIWDDLYRCITKSFKSWTNYVYSVFKYFVSYQEMVKAIVDMNKVLNSYSSID